HLSDVVERSHASGGEHRYAGRACHRLRTPDVGPALRAIAGDVCVDERVRPRVRRVTGQGRRLELENTGPAVHGDTAIGGIHAHDDALLEPTADLPEEVRVEGGASAHDGPARARLQDRL